MITVSRAVELRARFQFEVESERQTPILAENTELNGVITIDEIKSAISKQKDNACSPLDHITNSMLVAGGDAVNESLFLLFNMIFDSGMSPKQWQQGIMTMQPKAGDLTNWANYRGITLLSIVGKGMKSDRLTCLQSTTRILEIPRGLRSDTTSRGITVRNEHVVTLLT